MKYLFTFLICLSSFSTAHACTEATDDISQKNLLIGYAASALGIDLLKTVTTLSPNSKAISATNYKKSFTGAVGGPSCFARMTSTAVVTLTTYNDRDETCISTIKVVRVVLAGGQSSTVTTSQPKIACQEYE